VQLRFFTEQEALATAAAAAQIFPADDSGPGAMRQAWSFTSTASLPPPMAAITTATAGLHSLMGFASRATKERKRRAISIAQVNFLEPCFDTPTSESKGRRLLVNRELRSSMKSGGGFCNRLVLYRCGCGIT
jgi:hypothetical protein